MLRILFVCLALCVSLPAHAQSNRVGSDTGGKASATKANQKPADVAPTNYLPSIDVRLRQIARLLDSKIASEESYGERQRAERDLQAQETMASWGPYMYAIGLAEIVITGFGVWLVRRTILESRAATEDDIRPYVQVSRCKFERPERGKGRFIVKIQNSGSTPATFFEVCFSVKALPITEEGVDWEIPETLDRRQMWNALGGNDSITVGLYDPNFTSISNDVAIEKKLLYVLGKVRYGDIWSNEYETQFAYWVRDTSETIIRTASNSIKIEPRKMSRATGSLQTYVQTKQGGRDQKQKGRYHWW